MVILTYVVMVVDNIERGFGNHYFNFTFIERFYLIFISSYLKTHDCKVSGRLLRN